MFRDIKAIFVDSEGTLKDENGTINLETQKSIENLKKIGIHVIVTSGLPRFIVEKISLKAKASNFIIASNGADIYDIKEKTSISALYLDNQFLYDLWKQYHQNFNFILGVGDFEYGSKENEYSPNSLIIDEKSFDKGFYQCHISQKSLDTTKTNILKELKDLKSMLKGNNDQDFIDKTLFFRLYHDLDNLKDNDIKVLLRLKRFLELRKLYEEIIHNYARTVSIANHSADFEKFKYYGETPWFSLNNSIANKGEGIKRMCEYFHLPKSSVVAIGNDYNDRTMIDKVKLFLCPSNSCQYILQRSNYFYDKSEGISKVFEKVYHENRR